MNGEFLSSKQEQPDSSSNVTKCGEGVPRNGSTAVSSGGCEVKSGDDSGGLVAGPGRGEYSSRRTGRGHRLGLYFANKQRHGVVTLFCLENLHKAHDSHVRLCVFFFKGKLWHI